MRFGIPVLLRELGLLGGLAALFLVPVRPEQGRQLIAVLLGFASYKLSALVLAWYRPSWLQRLRVATRALDYVFVFLLVWLTGGITSQFTQLYFLLVALDAYENGHWGGLIAALFSTLLYAGDHVLGPRENDWPHVAGHVGVLFMLGSVLGWLSDRERAARAGAEKVNHELEEALRQLQVAQEKLVQAERLAAVGQMSSRVAHEVRNPLGAIILNLALLGKALPAEGEAAEVLAATKEQVQVLSSITEDYLQLGQLARPRPEPVDPAGLLAGLHQALEPELLARGVRLVLEEKEPLPTVVADPRLLRQAFINLIKNAGEAVSQGGTVRLGAAGGEGHIEFWVADDGPGIAPADLSKIFEPFYTTKPGGTGLGLAVVQQVALEHRGTVRCESRPGLGTRFTLRLPLGAPETKEEPTLG